LRGFPATAAPGYCTCTTPQNADASGLPRREGFQCCDGGDLSCACRKGHSSIGRSIREGCGRSRQIAFTAPMRLGSMKKSGVEEGEVACYTVGRSAPPRAGTTERRRFGCAFQRMLVWKGKRGGSSMALDRVDGYLEAHRTDFEEQLNALIRIPHQRQPPQVGTPPRGRFIRATCRYGLQGRADSPRGPSVYARASEPGKHTLLIYVIRCAARPTPRALLSPHVRANCPRRNLRPRDHDEKGRCSPLEARGLAQRRRRGCQSHPS